MTVSSTVRASRPLALIATAVVLVRFAFGGWVPLARITESPRRSTAAPKPATDPGRAQAEKAGIDVDAVVDKVRHRVTPAEDDSGALATDDEQYRARFDAAGFAFTLGEHPSRFGVSLRGVQRGGADLALVPGAWRGEANVAVRGLGSGMTERVTAGAGELEWDVVLDRALPGTGDLRVEAEVHGLDGAAVRLADHWRFPLGDGGAARMGEVIVKDATGAELHRALPQVRGDVVRLDLPASVLTNARYPLTIDPVVGPEQHVGGDPVYVPDGAGPEPAVASNGTDFLVVWEDLPLGSFTGDIRGTRVSAGGVVLDPGGIPISTAVNDQSSPAIAWSGTDFSNFLVVWSDERSGSSADIYGARVSAGGSVLDPAGIAISTAADRQTAPAVAKSGGSFLVLWQDNRSGTNYDIYGARVFPWGYAPDPGGIAISTAAGDQTVPALAWATPNYLVVWQDFRSGTNWDIYGVRVSSTGTLLDASEIPISTGGSQQLRPAVAGDGTNFLVAWDGDGGPNIRGARVSGAGVVLDPSGITITAAAGNQIAASVAWNGTTFLVAWQDARCCPYDIYGARVSTSGIVLDPAGIPMSTAAGDQFAPAVAWSGTNFLVVWQSRPDPNLNRNIYGARVSGAGTVLDPAGIAVSTAASDQGSPAVAWNGTNFFVVWSDSRSGGDIYGIRVDGSGTVLDPAGIPIAAGAGWEYSPAVAWNGTNFFVVWTDSFEIRGARVSAAGSVLDPFGIVIATADLFRFAAAVAWNGTNFFVVWSDNRADQGEDDFWYDIYGARVTGAGTVLDPQGIPISNPSGSDQIAPAVAWNGTTFLVAWQDHRSLSTSDIYGARVSAGGGVLDSAGIPISTAAGNQSQPALASWRDNFLVVWDDRRSGTDYDIYGTGVGGDGTVAQPAGIPISTAVGDQRSPDLAVRYDFLVAWRDRRSGTDDVYATRVSPSGVVHEPAGFLVASAPPAQFACGTECTPAVTGGPGTGWVVAYSRYAPEAPYGSNRVFLRSVSPK